MKATEQESVLRTFELVLVCIALTFTVLPMAVTALFVWASLGRPLMFSQVRCGKGGRLFEIRKFRSMTDARDAHGELLPDAERQTPMSRLLRRSRMDELPQLFAILKGDMAFVGPRPLMPETIERHGILGARRCAIRPGVTGWAQINGNTALSEKEKLTLDLWYIAHRNFWLDLRIIVETFRVLLWGEHLNSDRLAQAQSWLRANPVMPDVENHSSQAQPKATS